MWQYSDIVVDVGLCKASAAGHICGHNEKRQTSERRWPGIPWHAVAREARRDYEAGGLDSSETLAATVENLEQLGLYYVDHLMVH